MFTLGLIFASAPGLAMTEAPAETAPLPVLQLAQYPPLGFLKDRRALEAALTERRAQHGADSPQAADALLDLAEFHLAHVLVAEGRSLLDGLGRRLSPEMAARRAALELAFALLDSRGGPPPDSAAALLGPAYAAWPDQPLFAALAHRRAGDMAAAGEVLAPAAARLDHLSPRMQEELLPALLDVAVTAARWDTARALAARFGSFDSLRESPAYGYLLGRTAQAGGDLLSAFDYFRAAGEGGDLWAHLARVALIELGLDSGTLAKEDARRLMAQASAAWSGDSHAIALLQRRAALEMELDDPVAALELFAAIVTRHPDSPPAALARQQARSLWTEFYARGARGEIPLAEFLSGHRRVAMDYRFEPGFDLATEQLADRFLAAGATMAASDEYRDTHDYLLVAQDLGIVDTDDLRLDALRLKQAEAFYRGGQLDPLSYLLAEGLRSNDPALGNQLNLLKARFYAERGEAEQLVDIRVAEPTLHYLRLRAAALCGQQNWPAAQAADPELLDRAGTDMAFGDTVRLLLSAYRAGDRATTLAMARQFPELSESPQWAYIAQSITEEAPALLPLREASARERVDNAGRTLQALEALKN